MRSGEESFLLVLILIVLIGVAVLLGFEAVSIDKNQHIQICLDHPTYPKCEDEWSKDVVLTHN